MVRRINFKGNVDTNFCSIEGLTKTLTRDTNFRTIPMSCFSVVETDGEIINPVVL